MPVIPLCPLASGLLAFYGQIKEQKFDLYLYKFNDLW